MSLTQSFTVSETPAQTANRGLGAKPPAPPPLPPPLLPPPQGERAPVARGFLIRLRARPLYLGGGGGRVVDASWARPTVERSGIAHPLEPLLPEHHHDRLSTTHAAAVRRVRRAEERPSPAIGSTRARRSHKRFGGGGGPRQSRACSRGAWRVATPESARGR